MESGSDGRSGSAGSEPGRGEWSEGSNLRLLGDVLASHQAEHGQLEVVFDSPRTEVG